MWVFSMTSNPKEKISAVNEAFLSNTHQQHEGQISSGAAVQKKTAMLLSSGKKHPPSVPSSHMNEPSTT